MNTLELLIALALFTLMSSTAVAIALENQSIAVHELVARELITEAVSSLSRFELYAKGHWNELEIYTAPSVEGIEVDFSNTDISSCAKKTTSTAKEKQVSRSVSSIIVNENILESIGFDCAVVPMSGDWSVPKVGVGAHTEPQGEQATDIDVIGPYAYVGVDPTLAASADFFIFDIDTASTTSSPRLIKSLNTGPGINAIDATRNLIFAATVSRNAQLQIIDVTNPEAPYLRSQYKLPGTYTDATVGQSIFYYGSRVYLGTNKSQIAELHVIDVSDPDLPFEVGSFEVDAGVNSIFVQGDFAYIATPNNEELTVLDVHYPAHIMRVGGFDAPRGSGNGKSIFVLGKQLFLGRTVGDTELFILDISNPSMPKELGSYNLNASITSIRASENYLFITTTSSKRLEVFDITDLTNPREISSLSYIEKPTGMDMEDGRLFITHESGEALKIVDSETPYVSTY